MVPMKHTLSTSGLLGVIVAYAVVLHGVPVVTTWSADVAYGDLANVEAVVRSMLVPAVAAMLLVLGVVSALGWWSSVLNEPSPAPRWVWSVAAVLIAAVLIVTNYANLSDTGATVSLVMLAACVASAIGGELLFRGVALVAWRAAGLTEHAVAMKSSFSFAVVTLIGLVSGGPRAFSATVVTSAIGYFLYLIRRVSGTVLVPIAVSALWMFGLASNRIGSPDEPYLPRWVAVAAVIALAVVVRVRRAQIWEPADTDAGVGRRVARGIGRGFAIAVALAVAMLVVPVPSTHMDSLGSPATTFAEATAQFQALSAAEDEAGVYDPCRSAVLDHGERTAVAVVLFHGLTNCPKQFLEFAQQLYDGGANVVVLRAPLHGLAGEDGQIGNVSKVGELSAQALRDFADDSVDIAAGLGDEVRVLGLSMGGVLAMWTSVFRDDVERAVVVAPAISIPPVPHFLTTGFINLGNRLPNVSLPSTGKLDHAYAGESTGALSGMFLLAQANENVLTGRPAAADEVIVVLNPNDDQVDNDEVSQLVSRWKDADGAVEVVTFPDVGLPHDVIDKDQPTGSVDLVYPVLLSLLGFGS
jgi:pimeloyl-ACP methyl ester carboxylesterase